MAKSMEAWSLALNRGTEEEVRSQTSFSSYTSTEMLGWWGRGR